MKGLLFFFFIFTFWPGVILAEVKNLLIVEVQIAGQSSSNDFIKIYNPTDNDLDISGFKLKKRSSIGKEYSIKVFPKGSKILSKNYFLWANSQDDFHLTLKANTWSKATLAKNNSLALLNSEGKILDSLAWGKSQNPFLEGQPFPENPGPNQKLTRKKINSNYQDTDNNNRDFYLNPPSETSPPSPKEETKQIEPQPEEKTPNQTYPSNIFINEILPSPLGPDETKEWIEIFNPNNFEIDLSFWKIQDKKGKTKIYTFQKGTKISSQGFLVLTRPISKITLNNDGDELNLINPDGDIVDQVSYEKAPQGQSFNRTETGWIWGENLTPGAPNIISQISKKEEKEETTKISEKGLAALGENFPKFPRFFLIFFIAIIFAIFSGIIILLLKKELKRIYNKN